MLSLFEADKSLSAALITTTKELVSYTLTVSLAIWSIGMDSAEWKNGQDQTGPQTTMHKFVANKLSLTLDCGHESATRFLLQIARNYPTRRWSCMKGDEPNVVASVGCWQYCG
jgi:hypothetical protein